MGEQTRTREVSSVTTLQLPHQFHAGFYVKLKYYQCDGENCPGNAEDHQTCTVPCQKIESMPGKPYFDMFSFSAEF